MASANGILALTATINEALTSGLKAGVIVHSFDLGALQTLRLSSGTGAGAIDLVYSTKETAIAASGTLDVDFAGSVSDTFGTVITMAKVKLVLLYNAGTVAISVKSKAAAAFGWMSGTTDSINLAAGACLFYFDPTGVSVTGGATDKITITNLSGSVASAHTLLIAGTSA